MSTSGHGDPVVYKMTPAERFRHCFGLEVPKYKRQCLYGSEYPCNMSCKANGGCRCAEEVREEEAA